MGATSIHVQAVKPGSEIHNNVRPELSHLNEMLTYGATSIHVQAVKPGSEIHNFREKKSWTMFVRNLVI